jgi:hypothetical protein
VNSGGTDSNLIGGDYLVNIPLSQGGSIAAITRATSSTSFSRVGTTTVAFSSSQLQLSFPLVLLGGADGHMAFKVVSAQYLNGGAMTTGESDVMSDVGLPPGTVQ